MYNMCKQIISFETSKYFCFSESRNFLKNYLKVDACNNITIYEHCGIFDKVKFLFESLFTCKISAYDFSKKKTWWFTKFPLCCTWHCRFLFDFLKTKDQQLENKNCLDWLQNDLNKYITIQDGNKLEGVPHLIYCEKNFL